MVDEAAAPLSGRMLQHALLRKLDFPSPHNAKSRYIAVKAQQL
jgi:hypothetical protein